MSLSVCLSHRLWILISMLLASGAGAMSRAQSVGDNLLSNGSFETGTKSLFGCGDPYTSLNCPIWANTGSGDRLPGWHVFRSDWGGAAWISDSAIAEDGNGFLTMGAGPQGILRPGAAYLSSNPWALGLVPGDEYELSFWVAPLSGVTSLGVSVNQSLHWNGVLTADSLMDARGSVPLNWQQVSLTFTALAVEPSSDGLEFGVHGLGPATNGWPAIAIDNVSLHAVVPEPGTGFLLLMLGLAIVWQRRPRHLRA